MLSKRGAAFVLICCGLIQLPASCFNPQDDAKVIFDAPDRDKALLEILPQRTFDQCSQINQEFSKLNNGVPLVDDVKKYNARNHDHMFRDIVFAKIYGPEMTKITLMKAVFKAGWDEVRHAFNRDNYVVFQILILEDKNRPALINSYNHYSERPFIDEIKSVYDDDFEHFFLSLCDKTREEENGGPNPQEVDEAVTLLNKERKKHDSFNDHRQQLDKVLMTKPINFARAVFSKYAESNHGNTLWDDIGLKFDDNSIMTVAYTHLICFIQDPYNYMAERIFDSTTESDDSKSTDIFIIVGNSENGELVKINEAFKAKFKKSIKDYLLEKDGDDISRQMLAAIVSNSLQ